MYGQGRYGWYRYGYSSTEGMQRGERSIGEEEGGVTPEEAFGAGIALATQEDNTEYDWDFVVDESGALASTRGTSELAKDIAFITAAEYHTLIGDILDINTLADIETVIQDLVLSDDRVQSIQRINAEQKENSVDTIYVELEFVGEDGQLHEHIFPLSN